MYYVSCTKCSHKDLVFDDFKGVSTYVCESCQRKTDASEGKDIDTDNLSNIVCPYCGYEIDETDSCEMASSRDYGTHTCDGCERDFEWGAEVHVEFSTSKVDAKEPTDDNS